MVEDPLHSTVAELARSAFAGKPYTVSEVNHPFPAEHACEGIPILAAYAALQDWDGVFWYTLAHSDVTSADGLAASHFDLAPDPVKMAQIAAGSLMFLRADIAAARQAATRGYTRDQVIESIRLPWSESPFFDPGFSASFALQYRVRIASLEISSRPEIRATQGFPLRSDTGELTWAKGEKNTGLVIVNTKRSQAVIGFCGKEPLAVGNLGFESQTPFCAVTLSAIESKPIAQASKLVLTTGGRTANTEMEWNTSRNSLVNWGKAPVLAESVRGTIHLSGLRKARMVTIQRLDSSGVPDGQAIQADHDPARDVWSISLTRLPGIWYIINVRR
jgi:hypothetical protein